MFNTIPLGKHADWGRLALRLAIAGIFLAHGSMKWAYWSALPEGMPTGMVTLFKLLSVVEPLGGLAMLAGFLTRYAALGLGIIMLGAIYMKIAVMGVPYATGSGMGWEVDALILAGCLVVLFEGPGKYSLDAVMRK